jgi:predicted nuclease with TOPRIM domain
MKKMKEQLEQRLKDLKAEFEYGKEMLADLEAKQANVRDTLLRLSGAIQVLEELLAGAQPGEQNGTHSPQIQQVLQAD